ncbi:hypothetical protein LBMAG53_09160 [Planctomycetota bacterium]|nr:hypothetical protein LBMAG53_09160 [Planctomycetota bacterium]
MIRFLVPSIIVVAAVASAEDAAAWRTGWPNYLGPNGNWSASDAVPLTDDPRQAPVVWQSEQPTPAGIAWGIQKASGGGSSPVLADGRAFVWYYEPSGGIPGRVASRPAGAIEKGIVPPSVRWVDADDVTLAVDAATGQTLWLNRIANSLANVQSDKTCAPENNTAVVAALADGRQRVVVLSAAFRLSAYDAETGALAWQNHIGQATREAVLDHAQAVHCRSIDFGHVHGAGSSALAALAGVVLVKDQYEHLLGFDLATGVQRWSLKVDSARGLWEAATIIPWRGKVLINGVKGALLCVDPANGAVVWSLPMGSTPHVCLVGDDLIVSSSAKPQDFVYRGKLEAASQGRDYFHNFGSPGAWRLSDTGGTRLWDREDLMSGTADVPYALPEGRVVLVRYSKPPAEVESDTGLMLLDAATGRSLGPPLSGKGAPAPQQMIVQSGGVSQGDRILFQPYVYKARSTIAYASGGPDGLRYLIPMAESWVIKSTPVPGGFGPYAQDITTSLGAPVASYGLPVAKPLAAGFFIVRCQDHLRCWDLRADRKVPAPYLTAKPLPAAVAAAPPAVRDLGDRHASVRAAAVARLGKLPEHADAVAALLPGSDALTAQAAASVLTALRPANAVAVLRQRLDTAIAQNEREVAGACAAALTALGQPIPTDGPLTIGRLSALAGAGDQAQAALPQVIAVLKTTDDPRLAQVAVQTVAAIGGGRIEAVQTLVTAAGHADPLVAADAWRGLRDLVASRRLGTDQAALVAAASPLTVSVPKEKTDEAGLRYYARLVVLSAAGDEGISVMTKALAASSKGDQTRTAALVAALAAHAAKPDVAAALRVAVDRLQEPISGIAQLAIEGKESATASWPEIRAALERVKSARK